MLKKSFPKGASGPTPGRRSKGVKRPSLVKFKCAKGNFSVSIGKRDSTAMPFVEEGPIPSDPPKPSLDPRFDAKGHWIPPTEAERKARVEAVRRMIDEIAGIPDDATEDDGEVYRAIDAERPERPLFDGMF